jgi:ADP-ribose pyrophosphatase YjhB (NUDIX family)
VTDPGVWSTWGGGVEPGESLEQTVRRELAEEAGYTGPIKLERLHTSPQYATFIGRVPREFEPRLNHEGKDWCWVDLDQLPEPMHPALSRVLQKVSTMESQSLSPESLRTAQQLVKDLEAELADYYDASRGSVPADYRNQVRRRIEALNQELQDLGYKYAPTAPGKVAPLGTKFVENFADGKKPGRKGLSRRVGIPKKATLAQLSKIAKSSTGERRRMAQWQLNMRRGKARKNK